MKREMERERVVTLENRMGLGRSRDSLGRIRSLDRLLRSAALSDKCKCVLNRVSKREEGREREGAEGERGTAEAKGGKKWTKVTSMADARNTVKDVKFAPRHLGLKLVRRRKKKEEEEEGRRTEKGEEKKRPRLRWMEPLGFTRRVMWHI